jgi:hypothetical protein
MAAIKQAVALGQRHAGDLLVARAEHHAVDAVLRGAAGLPEARGHAGQVEQLDDHVLQHVPRPGALGQALDEAAALAHAAVVLDERRQQPGQAVGEAVDLVGGEVFQRAQVEPDFEHRTVGPEIGTAQIVDAQQLDVVETGHANVRCASAEHHGAFKRAHGDRSESAPDEGRHYAVHADRDGQESKKHNATSRSSRHPGGRNRGGFSGAEKPARSRGKRSGNTHG